MRGRSFASCLVIASAGLLAASCGRGSHTPTSACNEVSSPSWAAMNLFSRAMLTGTHTTIPDVDVTAVWICTPIGACRRVFETQSSYFHVAFRWVRPGQLTIATSDPSTELTPPQAANAPQVRLVRVSGDFEEAAGEALGRPLRAEGVVYDRLARCRNVDTFMEG